MRYGATKARHSTPSSNATGMPAAMKIPKKSTHRMGRRNDLFSVMVPVAENEVLAHNK
ncbi:hypothetical protein HMPREF1279_01963 [Propionibacterium sp. KPL1852]|nr:hypothetical protein HMPREF1271_01437 [Propionibacterium sp. KPL1838]ERS65862.1 hypothetical protein HMPREF1279_01963 [Propionibacterium sp. KPL1852]